MWVYDNSLGNMRGPEFLGLYAVVILTVWLVVYLRRKAVDTTDWHEPPPISKSPNPHEVAQLRGGVHELARTLIAVLVDLKLVNIGPTQNGKKSGTPHLVRSASSTSPFAPDSLEARALGYFDVPRTPAEVFQSGGLCDRLSGPAMVIEDKLIRDQLLTSPIMRSRAARAALQGFVIIAGLGLYKFAAALHHGRHNVGFLVIFGIMGSVALIPIGRLPRLTERGRRHIERLRMAFGSIRLREEEQDPAMRASTAALAAAIFGMTAIGGLGASEMRRAFVRAGSHAGMSGCGAVYGCGAAVTTSSSCGGSSCGGGGCGGGGCGGCGGG